jgi:hypothetical protein
MSDPIAEGAKATQEVAKATSKGLEVVQSLGGWLDRMFGESIEHSVRSIWTNKVRERSIASAIYSWERLELLAHKTEERLQRTSRDDCGMSKNLHNNGSRRRRRRAVLSSRASGHAIASMCLPHAPLRSRDAALE